MFFDLGVYTYRFLFLALFKKLAYRTGGCFLFFFFFLFSVSDIICLRNTRS